MYVFAEFEKRGILRYISHLDLQRAMTRLLLRTDLPIVFSEGFNPHPKLTFAQPLSIFQESVCEIAVFRMDGPPPEEKTLEALRRQGLMEHAKGFWRLTRRGMDVQNAVLVELMD